MWQDYMLTFVQFLFTVSILPMVFDVLSDRRDPPPLVTSTIQALGLLLIGTTFASLSFWLSAMAASILCICWFLMGCAELAKRNIRMLSTAERRQLYQLQEYGWIGVRVEDLLDQNTTKSLIKKGLAFEGVDSLSKVKKVWINRLGRTVLKESGINVETR